MILIETSDDKAPPRELMGDRSDDNKCVLQYLDTAFYEGVDNDDRADCKKKDGHVPRNLRICLSLIDLAAPYVHIRKSERNEKDNTLDIEWKVGGAVSVDSNQIVWMEVDDGGELPSDIFEKVEDNRYRIK